MRTVKIPALSNSESAMTEVEFDRLLDAVKMAIEPALRKELLTRRRTFNKRAKAANDQFLAARSISGGLARRQLTARVCHRSSSGSAKR
jgi:hypothetical protein